MTLKEFKNRHPESLRSNISIKFISKLRAFKKVDECIFILRHKKEKLGYNIWYTKTHYFLGCFILTIEYKFKDTVIFTAN